MELMQRSKSGYNWYRCNILGHVFTVMQTPDNHFSFGAPYGDNERDKRMFDELVYNNKSLYHGKDWFGIKQDIKNFILNFK